MVFSLVSCEVLINRRCKYFLLITIVTQWFFCRNKTRAGEMWRTFGLWHFDLSLPGRGFWSASKSVYFFASSDPSVGRHCALIIVKKLLTVGESSGWWLCSGASHWRHHCHEPWWYDAEMERRQIKSYGITYMYMYMYINSYTSIDILILYNITKKYLFKFNVQYCNEF